MADEVEVTILPNGDVVKFFPENHIYYVNDVQVPSVTQKIQEVNGDSYDKVNPELLERSAKYGTKIHKQIQGLIELRDCGWEIEDIVKEKDQETRNYFTIVEPLYKIIPLFVEKVVVLYNNEGVPVAAGRFDLACRIGEKQELAICDFKTTSVIHTKSVSAQLNLYKKAAEQSGYFNPGEITYLGAIHLSGSQCKVKPIQIFGEAFFEKYI
jgi:hypothetical protein